MSQSRFSVRLVAALVLGCLGGCARDTVTANIGPEGGTLTSLCGAELRVPAGALARQESLSITCQAQPTSTSRGTWLGKSLLLGPEGLSFHQPVELVIPYDPAVVPSGVAPDAVRVYTAAKGSGMWAALDTTVDSDSGLLVTRTLHFSSFAPLAPSTSNPLFITMVALPAGTLGSPYGPLSLSATGGTPPYSWNQVSGSFPPGLTISGSAIQGTPTTAGGYAFTLRVSDSAGQTLEKPFTLDVPPAGVNPAPTVNEVSPTTIATGSGDTEVVLAGMNFASGCQAFIGSTALSTLFQSSTQVLAVVPASLLAAPGTLRIGVSNPAPGGGPSNTVPLTVGGAIGLSVNSVNPSQAVVGSGPVVITVSGNGYAPGSAVTLDGNTLPTTYVSPTQLTATIPASSLTAVRGFTVEVSNILIGGGVSNRASFFVVNAPPVLSDMSPVELPAGYPTTHVTLTGSAFASNGYAQLGALQLATQVLGPTQAIVTVPANALVNPGTFQLTFINPAPGGGPSLPIPFRVVTLPAPLVLASSSTTTGHVAVDDVAVYWTDRAANAVKKVPINGGTVTTLGVETGRFAVEGIAVANCDVFWATQGDISNPDDPIGAIMGVPVNGGDPGEVTQQRAYANLIRYDAATGQLFWSTGPDVSDRLFRAPVTGGAVTQVGYVGWIEAFELDDTSIYVVSRGTGSQQFLDGGLLRMNKDGTGATWLINSQHDPRGLALSNGRLYWAVEEGEIRAMATSGAGGATVFAAEQGAVADIVTDGTNLYWATGGDIRMEPLVGGPIRIIAFDPGESTVSLAVDGANVYWLTSAGHVKQTPKPGGSGGPPATGACAGSPGWLFPARISNVGGFGSIVSDGVNVYWTDGAGSRQGHVYKLPVSGAAMPTALASGQGAPATLRIYGSELDWVNQQSYPGAVMFMGTSGTPGASVLSSVTQQVLDVAVDSTGSWWVTSSGVIRNGQVMSTYASGSSFVLLDATYVYWYNDSSSATWKMPKTGSPNTPIKVVDGAGSFPVLANNAIYWITSQGIQKLDLAAGPPAVTLVPGEQDATSLVVDGADVYWTTGAVYGGDANGKVKRLTGGTGTPVVLAEGQPGPVSVAVDGQNVYWLNAGTSGVQPILGGVMKLPKNARP